MSKLPKKPSTIFKHAIKANVRQIRGARFDKYIPGTLKPAKNAGFCALGLLENWNYDNTDTIERLALSKKATHALKMSIVYRNDVDHWTFQQFYDELRKLHL